MTAERTSKTLSPPNPQIVRLALERALASQAFRNSVRMSRFLQHVVDATLAGETPLLKEVCIGIAVFDRPPDYDPKLDPVVRNEARRLRGKLEQYYAGEGGLDTLRIAIPRGGYSATFDTVEPGLPQEQEEVVAPQREVVINVPPPAEAIARTPSSRHWTVAVAATLLLVTALAGFQLWVRSAAPKTDEFAGARFSNLTTLPTREVHPSISPDGQHVIYSSDQNGNYDIYSTTLDGQTTRLTRNEANDLHPVWSPDGQLFAFIREAGAGFDVVVSPVAGGMERKVGRVERLGFAVPGEDVLLMMGSPGPSWSPGGGDLAFTSGMSGTSARPILTVTLNSGVQHVLTHPPAGAHDFYPAYSPDGKWLAFCRLNSNSTSNVYIVPAAGGPEQRITRDNQDLRGLAWMPDGRSLVISSNRAGPQRLWQLDRNTGSLRAFPTSGASAHEPSVSPDGKWVVYSDYTVRSEIWKAPLSGANGVSLLPSTRQDHSAQTSPDGKSVAFVSDRSGSWEIWTVLADGSSPRQLTHLEGPLLGTPHWSPDSRYLAFDARPGGHSAIYIIPATGGTPRLLDTNLWEDKMPAWSRDGQWIYFNSNRAGTQQLWKIPAAGGTAVRLASEFAADSADSPDGRTVYFLSSTGIWEVPAAGGSAHPVRGLEDALPRRMWTVTPAGIWFLSPSRGQYGLWLYDFAARQVKRQSLLEPDVLLDRPGLSLTPDGISLVFSRQRESRSDLILVRGLQM